MTMNTKEKVWHELQKLGLMPEDIEGHIKFTYQMLDYVYIQDREDDDFFAMYLPNVQEVTEENELEVLRSVNECNNSLKAAKLCVNDGQVWIGIELFLQKEASLEDIVSRSARAIIGALMKLEMELKGL